MLQRCSKLYSFVLNGGKEWVLTLGESWTNTTLDMEKSGKTVSRRRFWTWKIDVTVNSYTLNPISRNELAQDKMPVQSSMKHDMFISRDVNVNTGQNWFIFVTTSTSGETRYGQPALEALEKSCSLANNLTTGVSWLGKSQRHRPVVTPNGGLVMESPQNARNI